MMRVAITGGIAEGKSTVLTYLAEAGYSTASADAAARAVFETEPVQAFLTESIGSTEHAVVRERLASDDTFRRELNRLTHPAIVAALTSSPAQFIEVPLLIEAVLQSQFTAVWVVTCGQVEQTRRLVSRLRNPDLAAEMLRTQLPTEVKIPFADAVVRTNCSEESVRDYVIEAAREISQ